MRVRLSRVRVRTARFLTLEDPHDRFRAVAALVVLTLISPFVRLPGSLPAIRLEQLLLAILVIPLAAFHRRHPEERHIGIVDLGFMALAISTALTLVVVPALLPDSVSRSFRDVFEIAWLVQYWLIYRLARTVSTVELSVATFGRWLALAAVVLAVFAALQFLNPPGFNELVTAIWTEAHNLLGVTREGRAVGTAGNANQFGILAALFLGAALANLTTIGADRSGRLFNAMVIGATVSLALAQSRGAILAAAVALAAGFVIQLAKRRAWHSLRAGLPPIALGGVLVLALMVVAPPESGTVFRRFDPAAVIKDPSLLIRLGRIQTLFGGSGLPSAGADRAACLSGLLAESPLPGHEPGPEAPPSPPPSMSADVEALAHAVGRHFCATGTWPVGDLAGALVPSEIPRIPTDPATGAPYAVYITERGFAVGQDAERPGADQTTVAPPGLGSLPSLITNSSFEDGGPSPAAWLSTPGASIQLVRDGSAAFGAAQADADVPAGGAIYQLVVSDLPASTEYIAGIWVRAATADAAIAQVYVVAITANGSRIDPLAESSATIPGDGAWHHLLVRLTTPDAHLTSLQVMFRAPSEQIRVALDGATLSEGPIARAFGSLVDVAPGSLVHGPSLGDSPVLGIGPQKGESVAAYDNEYASFLAHYGGLGLASYLFLFLSAWIVGVRAMRSQDGWAASAAVTVVVWTMALGGFALTAGAFHQIQVMLIFWTMVGLVAGSMRSPVSRGKRA